MTPRSSASGRETCISGSNVPVWASNLGSVGYGPTPSSPRIHYPYHTAMNSPAVSGGEELIINGIKYVKAVDPLTLNFVEKQGVAQQMPILDRPFLNYWSTNMSLGNNVKKCPPRPYADSEAEASDAYSPAPSLEIKAQQDNNPTATDIHQEKSDCEVYMYQNKIYGPKLVKIIIGSDYHSVYHVHLSVVQKLLHHPDFKDLKLDAETGQEVRICKDLPDIEFLIQCIYICDFGWSDGEIVAALLSTCSWTAATVFITASYFKLETIKTKALDLIKTADCVTKFLSNLRTLYRSEALDDQVRDVVRRNFAPLLHKTFGGMEFLDENHVIDDPNHGLSFLMKTMREGGLLAMDVVESMLKDGARSHDIQLFQIKGTSPCSGCAQWDEDCECGNDLTSECHDPWDCSTHDEDCNNCCGWTGECTSQNHTEAGTTVENDETEAVQTPANALAPKTSGNMSLDESSDSKGKSETNHSAVVRDATCSPITGSLPTQSEAQHAAQKGSWTLCSQSDVPKSTMVAVTTQDESCWSLAFNIGDIITDVKFAYTDGMGGTVLEGQCNGRYGEFYPYQACKVNSPDHLPIMDKFPDQPQVSDVDNWSVHVRKGGNVQLSGWGSSNDNAKSGWN